MTKTVKPDRKEVDAEIARQRRIWKRIMSNRDSMLARATKRAIARKVQA